MTPLILIDVDGVLKPEKGHGEESDGWQRATVQVSRAVIKVPFKPEHGEWLRQLAEETGAELAWGSRWGGFADLVFGTILGISGLQAAPTLPPVPKPDGFVPWTAGRPFVWFDDEVQNAEITDQIAGSQPHLVVLTDSETGLTEDHIATAREWLLSLPEAVAERERMHELAERLTWTCEGCGGKLIGGNPPRCIGCRHPESGIGRAG